MPVSPIYNDDPRFGTTLAKTSCPRLRDINVNIQNGSVPDSQRKTVLESSSFPITQCTSLTDFEFKLNPDASPYGCCVVESSTNTCDDYIYKNGKDGPKISQKDGEDYDMGLYVSSDTGGSNKRRICHSAPIRKRDLQVSEFCFSILWSALAISGFALLGACYEFWLIYGTGGSDDDIFAINVFARPLTPLDFAFPVDLQSWPYSVFGQFRDNANATLGCDGFSSFPTMLYNVSIRAFFKAFLANGVFTIYHSRTFIHNILDYLTNNYQKLKRDTKKNAIIKNVVFFILTGILFNIIAVTTGDNKYYIGFCSIFFLLLLISVAAMIFTFFKTMFNDYWWFGAGGVDNGVLFNGVECEPGANLSDYSIVSDVVMNFTTWILRFPAALTCFFTGFAGALVGLCYIVISLLFNMFFVPIFTGFECLCKIIQSHSELLIILFCASILFSSSKYLNSTTTTVIGLIVGIIVAYKLFIFSK